MTFVVSFGERFHDSIDLLRLFRQTDSEEELAKSHVQCVGFEVEIAHERIQGSNVNCISAVTEVKTRLAGGQRQQPDPQEPTWKPKCTEYLIGETRP